MPPLPTSEPTMTVLRILLLIVASTLTSASLAQADAAVGKAKSAACAACHAADGNSTNPEWPKLAGQHPAYLVKQLQDFKEGKTRSNALMSGLAASSSLMSPDVRRLHRSGNRADHDRPQQVGGCHRGALARACREHHEAARGGPRAREVQPGRSAGTPGRR